MEERSDIEKGDDIILPGFRFHPTDEELVGFYLKRKTQQKPLSIELIRQLDIYKYDPWDLPKLATTGEKEWYFYCPRDRKYRNSARPNRVTGAGFWKATGTDRPIYSSEGTKCIGLKKSLVFYKGRAAKGIKTDWMMHEFRLPSLTDSLLPKRPLDKDIPANDSWAICRIFKKTNSMAQRALSHSSWVSAIPEAREPDLFSMSQSAQSTQCSSEIISCAGESRFSIQLSSNNNLQQQQQQQVNHIGYPPLNLTSYKPVNVTGYRQSLLPFSSSEVPSSFMFTPSEMQILSKCGTDVASMLLNLSPAVLGNFEKPSASIDFAQQHQQCHGFPLDLPLEINASLLNAAEYASTTNRSEKTYTFSNSQWGSGKLVSFPVAQPANASDEWKPNLTWDSLPCPSEISSSYSTNNLYT